MVDVICRWDPTSEKKANHHVSGQRTYRKTLAPMAFARRPTRNMLGPDDSEQFPFAYGSNADALIAAKNGLIRTMFLLATPLRSGRRSGSCHLHKEIFCNTASRRYESNLKYGVHS